MARDSRSHCEARSLDPALNERAVAASSLILQFANSLVSPVSFRFPLALAFPAGLSPHDFYLSSIILGTHEPTNLPGYVSGS